MNFLKRTLTPLLAVMLIVTGFQPVIQPVQAAIPAPVYAFSTLSTALTVDNTLVNVASNTGFAPAADGNSIVAGNNGNLVKQVLIVDHEAMEVQSVTGTTFARVTRGYAGTQQRPHIKGSTVFVSPPSYLSYDAKSGTCNPSTMQVNPVFHLDRSAKDVKYTFCNGSTFVPAGLPGDFVTPNGAAIPQSVPFGSVAYASVGTDTTNIDGTIWWISVYIPQTMLVTNINMLQGTISGTDKFIGAIYDSGLNLIANSATAGVTSTTTNTVLPLPLTATLWLPGPTTVYVAVQTKGTTDKLRTVAASTFVGLYTSNTTGVFGTIPTTITLPTLAFNAGKGPVVYLN